MVDREVFVIDPTGGGLMAEYRINGAAVDGIADLYGEFNRLLMADEDWQLGPSLDALNDALYRVVGDAGEAEPIRFVWADHTHSRDALGFGTTRQWLQDKLDRPDVFNQKVIQRDLDALLAGEGKTYYELVLEVFADHPRVTLDLR